MFLKFNTPWRKPFWNWLTLFSPPLNWRSWAATLYPWSSPSSSASSPSGSGRLGDLGHHLPHPHRHLRAHRAWTTPLGLAQRSLTLSPAAGNALFPKRTKAADGLSCRIEVRPRCFSLSPSLVNS